MLRITSSVARRVARNTALGVAGFGAASTTGVVLYTNTENGLGLRRELEFWNSVFPVVFDYWWNLSSSSPKVKFYEQLLILQGGEAQEDASEQKKKKDELRKELHKQNAPRIFSAMLNLGGLYVKLGQVLSVTALPIPEEYRELFRTLQSNVPGHEDFDTVVKPTLEKELNVSSLDEVFSDFSKIPCGAASIGQAHKATLKETGETVIVKVQYPNAKWQVPADIQCVGEFLQLCVFFNLVDEKASQLSFQEFSRQFLSELDYKRERENLQQVYESSLNPDAPYLQRGVVIPRVFPELCTKQVITMTFLPGPKFEEEAKQQLEMLGFNTKQGFRSIVKNSTVAAEDSNPSSSSPLSSEHSSSSETTTNTNIVPSSSSSTSWKLKISKFIGNLVGVDSIFSMIRFTRRWVLYSTALTVSSIQTLSLILPQALIPSQLQSWANERQNSILKAERLDWTKEAVHTLLDIHGYQILNQGLFNADPHPGNILVVMEDDNENDKEMTEEEADSTTTTRRRRRSNKQQQQQQRQQQKPKIGLIDYGQCKRLTPIEQVKIAKLILSIADKDDDEVIAKHFRNLGIKTQNDNTKFLAEFGRLMFDSFQPKHLDHDWHKTLHQQDKVLYFPKELSMVYRTSLLLRGLAMSLQYNPSVGEQWRHHAKEAIERHEQQQEQ